MMLIKFLDKNLKAPNLAKNMINLLQTQNLKK
jgi:hypothetical protein